MAARKQSKIIFNHTLLNLPENPQGKDLVTISAPTDSDSELSERHISDGPPKLVIEESQTEELRERQAEFKKKEEQIRHKLLLLVLPLIYSASIAFTFREIVEFPDEMKNAKYETYNITISQKHTQRARSSIYYLFFLILYTGGAASSIFILLVLFTGRKNTDDKYLSFEDNFRYNHLEYSRYGDQTNLFLRFAILVCSLETLAYTITSIISESKSNCSHTISLIMKAMQVIYISSEGLVLILSNRIVFIKRAIVIKSLMYFLLTINLAEFTHSIVKDLKPIIYIVIRKVSPHFTDSCPIYTHYLSYYLLPGKLQYLLTSIFILKELNVRCGRLEFIQLILDPIKPIRERFKHSFIGIIVSFVLIMITGLVVTFSLLWLTVRKDENEEVKKQSKMKAKILLFVSDIGVNILGMGCNGLLLWQTRNLKPSIPFLTSKAIISFLNICIFCIACFLAADYLLNIPTIYTILNVETHLKVILSTIQILQVSLQMYAMRVCIFKCSCDFKSDLEKKPGRQAITALIGVNFSQYTMKDFITGLLSYQIYQKNTSNIDEKNLLFHVILSILSPFCSMFHFASLILYCDLFVKMYHKESHRVANLWQRLSDKSKRQSVGIFTSENVNIEDSGRLRQSSFVMSSYRESRIMTPLPIFDTRESETTNLDPNCYFQA